MEHFEKRTRDLKTLSVFPAKASIGRQAANTTEQVGCSFLVCLKLPLLAGSQLTHITAVVKPRPNKCPRNQDQDSAQEDDTSSLNQSEIMGHYQRRVNHQNNFKSIRSPPTQWTSCGCVDADNGAAGQ